MCGIVGIYNFDDSPVEIRKLKKMQGTLRHRGPDDKGIWVDGKIGFGHTLLKIIDLSEAAHQPMSDKDEIIWLVCDGEIYNYLELREELENLGHKFKSRADAEIIIHAYEEWGTECIKKFNGMWAFAIWDKRKQRLFLSRDRLGIKPLYYFYDSKRFIFASEIKAILEGFKELKNIDYTYLYFFLKFGELDTSAHTFFSSIKSLKPAHSLIIDNQGLRIFRYWDIQSHKLAPNIDDHADKLLYLLRDSVKLRLRADVPVGVSLSGGLDSSVITVLASEFVEKPINSFSAVWQDKEYDESNFINMLVSSRKVRPFFIEPKPEELFNELPKIIWHQDGPNPNYPIYAHWQVMKLAKNEIKVILEGQGGDELLGGYPRYLPTYLATLVREGRINKLLREWRAISHTMSSNLLLQVLRKLPGGKLIKGKKKEASIFNKDFENSIDKDKFSLFLPRPQKRYSNLIDDALYHSLTCQALPMLLHCGDRSSMAFSVEDRVPFLDYRVVEFCMSLPYEEKINGDITKYILRKALKGILPEKIRVCKDKKGFPTPVGKWFRNELEDKVKAILFSNSMRKRKIFNEKELRKRFELHISGAADCSKDIWRWLNTEIWFKEYI